jgi:hypothetical protein
MPLEGTGMVNLGALFPGKGPQNPMNRRLGGCFGEKKNLLLLLGIEP